MCRTGAKATQPRTATRMATRILKCYLKVMTRMGDLAEGTMSWKVPVKKEARGAQIGWPPKMSMNQQYRLIRSEVSPNLH